jgi:hypothetical protein
MLKAFVGVELMRFRVDDEDVMIVALEMSGGATFLSRDEGEVLAGSHRRGRNRRGRSRERTLAGRGEGSKRSARADAIQEREQSLFSRRRERQRGLFLGSRQMQVGSGKSLC